MNFIKSYFKNGERKMNVYCCDNCFYNDGDQGCRNPHVDKMIDSMQKRGDVFLNVIGAMKCPLFKSGYWTNKK